MKISTELTTSPAVASADPRRAASGAGRNDFQQILMGVSQARRNPGAPNPPPAASPAPQAAAPAPTPEASVTVRDGDTMVSIAQKVLQARGLNAGPQASMRAALQFAKDNGLANPDLIYPGQKIDVSSTVGGTPTLGGTSTLGGTPSLGGAQARELPASPPPLARAGLKMDMSTRLSAAARPPAAPRPANPMLEKTLDRAVGLQYFSASEKDAVRSKILLLAAEHHFAPDDLAIVTLIESDGMNPKANNGRCHGLIQFCDGPNRGAASVGYKDNPKAILNLSVLDQLDLVGKYFEETGLKNFGKTRPASLDDLYLTVLTPAARRERNLNADLEIAGQQAASLRSGGDPGAPITRASLLQGLRQNARDKLAATAAAPNRSAAQWVRVSAINNPDQQPQQQPIRQEPTLRRPS